MTETPSEAFRRGEVAGQTEQRLTGAEDHMAMINGQIGEMVGELKAIRSDLQDQNLKTQSLADAALAAANTAIALAAALKEADEQRRDKSEQAWSPLTRLTAVIVAFGGIVGLYLALKGRP